MENNLLSQKLLVGVFISVISFSGCAGMFIAGRPINADKYYPKFIGLKIMPIQPAAIIKTDWGLGVHIPYTVPYEELISIIPEGSIITIEQVVRRYNVYNEAGDTLMGRVDIPGFSGLVAVATCDADAKKEAFNHCINPSKFKILSN